MCCTKKCTNARRAITWSSNNRSQGCGLLNYVGRTLDFVQL